MPACGSFIGVTKFILGASRRCHDFLPNLLAGFQALKFSDLAIWENLIFFIQVYLFCTGTSCSPRWDTSKSYENVFGFSKFSVGLVLKSKEPRSFSFCTTRWATAVINGTTTELPNCLYA